MLISLLAAMDRDRVIGSAEGRIPWDLPRDREHFRARTAGRWLLVGRATYGEMEGWFGDRIPLVLTGNPAFVPFEPSHRIAATPAAAIDLAAAGGADELVVIGGGKVFAATLPLADQILLTRIDLSSGVANPVRFPLFEDSDEWTLTHAEDWPGDGGIPDARYEVYARHPARRDPQ